MLHFLTHFTVPRAPQNTSDTGENKGLSTYLHHLTIIHLHYVEIKTVYPWARGDEIAPFLIEIFTNVHKYLKEDADIRMEVK